MARHGMGLGRLPALQGPFPAPGEKRPWKGKKELTTIWSIMPLKFTFYHGDIGDSLKEAGWEQ